MKELANCFVIERRFRLPADGQIVDRNATARDCRADADLPRSRVEGHQDQE